MQPVGAFAAVDVNMDCVDDKARRGQFVLETSLTKSFVADWMVRSIPDGSGAFLLDRPMHAVELVTAMSQAIAAPSARTSWLYTRVLHRP